MYSMENNMQFNDGATYRNTKDSTQDDIYVLGVDELTKDYITMAVLFVNRNNVNDTEPGEITIESEDFEDWIELDEDEAYV